MKENDPIGTVRGAPDWESLLRTEHMADLKYRLGLDYLLPDDRAADGGAPRLKTALVLHIYYVELAEACCRYARSMPEGCDLIITTDTPQKKERIERVFRDGPWRTLRVVPIENRGRDVSALLVGAAPLLGGYDAVCFAHDKRSAQLDWGVTGSDFSERCFTNLLGTKALVENILALFAREPRLGLLSPPPPNHASYYPTLGVEWGPNYPLTERLHRQLELRCPISPDKEPVAPLGTMFWFRPAALKKLLEHGWRYEDFPPEPNGDDGTLLHAFERIYPYVAQDALYYSAWVMAERNAADELGKLSALLCELGGSLGRAYGSSEFDALRSAMDAYWRRPHDPRNPARLAPYLKGALRHAGQS